MNQHAERIVNGMIKENPTFVLMLGMCPTLAVTTSAVSGLGMGISTMVVLILSGGLISAVRNIIPHTIRIPAYIVIIAGTVSVIELLIRAYFPDIEKALGVYIPLIVVNCIILGRAEAYASSHSVMLSMADGLGMGLGFTVSLTLIGAIREIIGSACIFGYDFNKNIFGGHLAPVSIIVMAPGAFFVLAFLSALRNHTIIHKLKIKQKTTKKRINTNMSENMVMCEMDCNKCKWRC